MVKTCPKSTDLCSSHHCYWAPTRNQKHIKRGSADMSDRVLHGRALKWVCHNCLEMQSCQYNQNSYLLGSTFKRKNNCYQTLSSIGSYCELITQLHTTKSLWPSPNYSVKLSLPTKRHHYCYNQFNCKKILISSPISISCAWCQIGLKK